MDGPFPKVSLKHLPAGNLHRVPVVHTVWGKHTLCKWFFFWNGTHTTRDSVLMASVSAKANGCCVWVCLCVHSTACVRILYCIWACSLLQSEPPSPLKNGGIQMQTGVKSRQQGKKFVSLYIFQLIHKSGLLNVALMWTKQAERASRLQKQYHSFIWGLGGVTKVHNVILVSKPREGSVGNQILFAYFLFWLTLASTASTNTLK